MGKLADALKPQSSYAAKKTPLWEELADRIAGALLAVDLLEIETWLEFNELLVPWSWRAALAELIDKRRDELKAEDIGQIMRDRFDFT
jgi:hypothetical protein